VGKHTAADDSTVHPLVAEALSRRAGAPAGGRGEHSGSSTGWPEPEREGGGSLGWPDDTVAMPVVDMPGAEADRTPASLERTVTVASRRGWRRLFGASPAA
jgi:hypothetical protein